MFIITDAITIWVITISIIIIANITISPSPKAHTYPHNLWEASTRFRWTIRVGDLPIVLATGPGNLPAVWVWTGKTVWFGFRTIQ